MVIAERLPIEESFQTLTEPVNLGGVKLPPRREFSDPLLKSLENVALSEVIDAEFERHYEPVGAY